MSRPMLLGWVDTALALEQENAALRALVLDLAVALAEARDLRALALDEIARRFPEEKAA